MKVEVQIDSGCTEPKVIIVADRITEEIRTVIQKLSDSPASDLLAGFDHDRVELLEPAQIIRIYAESGKVCAQTASGIYTLRLRLYEIENRLDKTFARISNSEIINLKKVKGFDLSFSGTICVSLEKGIVTYVSRRYVSKIKQLLGI